MSQTPTGWKLVPIEPTEAMVEAGRIARMNVAGGYDGPSGWQAMLDAAPESPLDLLVGSEPTIYVSRKSLDELLNANGSHVALQTLIHNKPLRSGNGVALYEHPISSDAEKIAKAIWDSHELGDWSKADTLARGFHLKAARSVIAALASAEVEG